MKKILLLFLVLSLTAFSDLTYKLMGTIGTYPAGVSISFEESDSSFYGTYFYEKTGKDIYLEGKETKGVLTLTNKASYVEKKDNLEIFELKKLSNGNWEGIWKQNNKTLPVKLSPIDVNKIQNKYSDLPYIQSIKKEDLYTYYKLSNIELVKGKTEKFNDTTLQWYTEKKSDISYFRITNGYTEEEMTNINKILADNQMKDISESLSCSGNTPNAGEYSEYNLDIKPRFSDKNFISYSANYSYYCGGAHPDFGLSGVTINVKSGTIVNLDDILWFGKSEEKLKKSEGGWSDEESVYFNNIYAPKVVEILTKIYPKQMKETDKDYLDEPIYGNTDPWVFGSWYLTKKGIYVGAVFPRVARAFDNPDWSVIPYKNIEQYIRPDFKEYFKPYMK